jgi:hypothetical protein
MFGSVPAIVPGVVVIVSVVAVGSVKFVVVSTAVFVAISPGPPIVDDTPLVDPSSTTWYCSSVRCTVSVLR